MTGSRRNLDVSDGLVASRLQALRRSRGLGKSELADRAGVTYRTVHDLERGRRPRVQEKTLMLIAKGLEIPVAELLPEDGRTSPPRRDEGGATDRTEARTRRRCVTNTDDW